MPTVRQSSQLVGRFAVAGWDGLENRFGPLSPTRVQIPPPPLPPCAQAEWGPTSVETPLGSCLLVDGRMRSPVRVVGDPDVGDLPEPAAVGVRGVHVPTACSRVGA